MADDQRPPSGAQQQTPGDAPDTPRRSAEPPSPAGRRGLVALGVAAGAGGLGLLTSRLVRTSDAATPTPGAVAGTGSTAIDPMAGGTSSGAGAPAGRATRRVPTTRCCSSTDPTSPSAVAR